MVGGLLLWMLRLGLAPISTLAGFRRWVIEECPVAPGRRGLATMAGAEAQVGSRQRAAISGPHATSRPTPMTRETARPTKTRRFLDLVTDRYGPLAQFPIANVSRVCTELAPEIELNTGAARTALRRQVLAAQNGTHL
jgi:hypothetical protein